MANRVHSTIRTLIEQLLLYSDRQKRDNLTLPFGINPEAMRDHAVSSMAGGFGGIFNNDTPANNGVGTAFAKITGWTANTPTAQGTTPDFANDEITIDRQGVWFFVVNCSFASFTKNNTYIMAMFQDGVESPYKATIEVPSGGLDSFTLSFGGIIAAGDPLVGGTNPPPTVIDIRFRRVGGTGTDYDFINGALSLIRAGEGFI